MQISEGVRLRRITPSEKCLNLHIIRKPNTIIVLLFTQNISRALKKDKMHFIVFCNTIIFAVNCNASKIKRLLFVAIPVFYYLYHPIKIQQFFLQNSEIFFLKRAVNHFRAFKLFSTKAVVA